MSQSALRNEAPGSGAESRSVGTPVSNGEPAAWLTVAAAAEALGLTARHVRRMCTCGELTAAQDAAGTWWVDPASRPALAIAAGQPAVAALASDVLASVSADKRRRIYERLDAISAWRKAAGQCPAGTGRTEWMATWCEAWSSTRPQRCQKLSPVTLWRWIRAYDARGIAGLLDKRRHSGSPACSAAAWDLFQAMYLDEARPSVPRLYERVEAIAASEGWDWPTLRTVRRWAADRLDPKLAALGRSPKQFRDRMLPHVVRDWTKVHANEVWIADHRQFDIFIPYPHYDSAARRVVYTWRRPWLTAWMDGRSWKIVSHTISFDDPNGNRVMETFVQGVIEHGCPAHAIIDNGKDFRMKRFSGGRPGKGVDIKQHTESLLSVLGVTPHFAIPYNAKAKPIEVFFSVAAPVFDKTWETYCGNTAANKPERLCQKDPAEFARRGLTLESFARAFEAWLEADYSLRESPSTAADDADGNRLSPARAFAELRPAGYRAKRPAVETLMLLLMPSAPSRVTANGIYVKAFGQFYWSDALEDRRGASGRDVRRKIVYRYRPDDSSAVYVFDFQTDRFLCTATPYVGQGISPIAENASPDADRLAASMALQRSLAKDTARTLKTLRAHSGNALLASSINAADALGKLDRAATIPPAKQPVIQLVGAGQADCAGQAAARQKARVQADTRNRQTAEEFLQGNAARKTGTDDAPARPVVDALELLIDDDRQKPA